MGNDDTSELRNVSVDLGVWTGRDAHLSQIRIQSAARAVQVGPTSPAKVGLSHSLLRGIWRIKKQRVLVPIYRAHIRGTPLAGGPSPQSVQGLL